MFDPFDDRHWMTGAKLNWWEHSLAQPAWTPDPEQAMNRLMKRRDRMLALLAYTHSYRTVETSQLHALDPKLPAHATARLYLDMFAMGLIDLGYPLNAYGITKTSVSTAQWMAVRLPVRDRIERTLERLGCTPVEILTVGPGPLRAARQNDRHNLICASLAIAARQAGWRTFGELYGRFDLLCDDPRMGGGGPDLILIGENETVCVELTASAGQKLDEKFERWNRILNHPNAKRLHVCWLDADRQHSLLVRLDRMSRMHERMHAGKASDWLGGIRCDDGFAPQPGVPPQTPCAWMNRNMDRLASMMLGSAPAHAWRLPARLSGMWLV